MQKDSWLCRRHMTSSVTSVNTLLMGLWARSQVWIKHWMHFVNYGPSESERRIIQLCLTSHQSQSLRASGTPGFAHLTPRQWFQTLGLRRHEERAEAERHPHPQHESTEREQTYLGPACGRRWEKSGIFIKTLILYFILFLITTALSVAKPPHPTAPPLIHVSRAGCS